MGLLEATHGWGKNSPLPKICHTYPTVIKLGTIIPYLKRFQKIYKSRDAPLEICLYQHFLTRNQQLLLYQEIEISIAHFNTQLLIPLTFFEFLKVVLINMVAILMMSPKLAS